nr:hypothetical protein [uncultured Moellerella sp.]
MEEKIKDNTRDEFQNILNKTIFRGKHTRNTIARIKKLYETKKENASQSDLVLYSLIDFTKQNEFVKEIKSIISNFNKRKDIIEINVISELATTETTLNAGALIFYFDQFRFFLDNITNGLTDTIAKIECDSVVWGYPEAALDDLKKNIIKLNSELNPIKYSLSGQIFDLNDKLISQNKNNQVEQSEFINKLKKINKDIMNQSNKESVALIKAMIEKNNISIMDVPSVFFDESNINILTNSMMNCKYDKSTGASLTPLNDTNGYVQCGIFTTVKNIF